METEIWKDIPGYEGRYKASNYGRIYSCKRFIDDKRSKNRPLGGMIMKESTVYGYKRISLTNGKVRKAHAVHRLVMLSFVGPSSLTVNHIDMDKTNNHVSNLEYCTLVENTMKYHNSGIRKHVRYGSDHHRFKTTPKIVSIVLGMIKNGHTYSEIGEVVGLSSPTITKIKRSYNGNNDNSSNCKAGTING